MTFTNQNSLPSLFNQFSAAGSVAALTREETSCEEETCHAQRMSRQQKPICVSEECGNFESEQ